MTAAHAPLAPSNAERWGPNGCPGSVAMQQRYPEPEDSEAAREGTAAHEYLSGVLKGPFLPVGAIASNGVPINVDMLTGAEELVNDVTETARGLVLRVEERVDMADSVHVQNYGTPDVYAIDWDTRHLYVWDYKYGHGFVPAFRNMQLINYACGILECNGVSFADWTGWRIHVAIAQPRNYSPEGPLRKWSFSGSQLQDYAHALKRAAYEALAPGAELRTGPHCDYCSAIVHCPANQALGGRSIDISRSQVPNEMDAAAMGVQRKMIAQAIDRLKAMDTGLDAAMTAIITKGGNVPGWGAEYVKSRERWKLPADELIPLIRMISGVDVSKPSAMTPLQAVKAGLDPLVKSEYAETPRGAMRIVQVDASDALKLLGTR